MKKYIYTERSQDDLPYLTRLKHYEVLSESPEFWTVFADDGSRITCMRFYGCAHGGTWKLAKKNNE